MVQLNPIGANGWLISTGGEHYRDYQERIAQSDQSQPHRLPTGFATPATARNQPSESEDDNAGNSEVNPQDEENQTDGTSVGITEATDSGEYNPVGDNADGDDQAQIDGDQPSGNADGGDEPPAGPFARSDAGDGSGDDDGKRRKRFRRRVAAGALGVILLSAGIVAGVSGFMQQGDEYNLAQVETHNVDGEAIDANVAINQMHEDGSVASVQYFGEVDETGAIEVPLSVVAEDRFSVLGLVDIPGTSRDVDRPLRPGDTVELFVSEIGETDQTMRFRGTLGDNGLFDEESFELLTESEDGDLYEVVQVEQRMIDQDGNIVAEPKALLDEDGDIRVDSEGEPMAHLVITVVLSEIGSGGAASGYAPASQQTEVTSETATSTSTETSSSSSASDDDTATNVAIDQSAKQDEGSAFHALADTHTINCGGAAFLITGFWSQEGSEGIRVDSHDGLSPEAAEAIVQAITSEDEATLQYLTDEFCEQEMLEGDAEELTDLRTGETIKVHNALPEGNGVVETTDDTATPDSGRVNEMGAPKSNSDKSKQVVGIARTSDHGYTAQKVVCDDGDTTCEDTAPAAPQHDIDPEGSDNRDDDAMLD